MLASLSLIFIVGLAMGAICQKLKLPRIIGILVTGIVLGPYVLDAVSPAVVVPRMVTLMEKKYGTEKAIPQMIMAGVSCDDIFVIVLFTSFSGMAQGGSLHMQDFVNIPVSIVLGCLLGALTGWILSWFFEKSYEKGSLVRNSTKVLIILGFSFLMMVVEGWLKERIAVSGLLAVVSMACVIKKKTPEKVSGRLSEKFGKLWIAAEVVLFVLVGAAVDIRYTMQAGLLAVFMIALALAVRAIGVLICLAGTELNKKERLFCVIAYLPKATVQASQSSL